MWWIGIGHAGTLISAILAAAAAGVADVDQSLRRGDDAVRRGLRRLFPLLHMGRPWLFYWLFPYPNTMDLWPQFRSPLVWDVFAVSTYATVSLLFWYAGLIPDVATLRDRARNHWARLFYGVLALGWRGSARHWQHHQTAYLLLAGLATPLVLSVHIDRGFGFCRVDRARLAQHDLPALFRRRGHFLGLRHGADVGDSAALAVRPGRIRHAQAPGQRGQGDAGDRLDRRLRLLDRSVLRLLQRQHLRAATGGQRVPGPLRLELFGPDRHQLSACRSCSGFRRCGATCKLLWMLSLVIQVGMWLERFVIVVISLQRDYSAVVLAHVLSDDLGLRMLSARSVCSSRCSSCSFACCR